MKRVKKTASRLIVTVLILHAFYIQLIAGMAQYLIYANPPCGTLMLYRSTVGRHDVRDVAFVPIVHINPIVTRGIVAAEDPEFMRHRGINVRSMIYAYRMNRHRGYYYWGGSTITQQLVRTLFLVPAKSLARKYLEIIGALILELYLPKWRILELYVNYAEFGPGVFGIERAARHYFRKSSGELTNHEIIRLITIMPNPLRFGPDNFRDNAELEGRYRFLMNNFR